MRLVLIHATPITVLPARMRDEVIEELMISLDQLAKSWRLELLVGRLESSPGDLTERLLHGIDTEPGTANAREFGPLRPGSTSEALMQGIREEWGTLNPLAHPTGPQGTALVVVDDSTYWVMMAGHFGFAGDSDRMEAYWVDIDLMGPLPRQPAVLAA